MTTAAGATNTQALGVSPNTRCRSVGGRGGCGLGRHGPGTFKAAFDLSTASWSASAGWAFWNSIKPIALPIACEISGYSATAGLHPGVVEVVDELVEAGQALDVVL